MSKEQITAFRNLSEQELDQKRAGFEKEIFELNKKKITGQLDKPHLFKILRKQIAQINTLKREKKTL